jgi:hypothetical protein
MLAFSTYFRLRAAIKALISSSAARISKPPPRAGVLGEELDGVAEIPGFQKKNAPQLFLGLGIGAIGDRDLSASATDSCSVLGGLKCFTAQEVPALAKLIVVSKTAFHERFTIALRQLAHGSLFLESKANESHVGNLVLGE